VKRRITEQSGSPIASYEKISLIILPKIAIPKITPTIIARGIAIKRLVLMPYHFKPCRKSIVKSDPHLFTQWSLSEKRAQRKTGLDTLSYEDRQTAGR
jgi:hypothetical protein